MGDRKMNKKLIIILSTIIAFIIAAAVLLWFPRNASVVTTTSGFISTSYHYYDANSVFKFKLPSTSVNEEVYKEHSEKNKKALEEALAKVLEADSDAFCDEYTSVDACVFELDGCIYYYRTCDTKNVYKLNTSTGEITSFPFSGYNSYVDRESFADQTTIDHNTTVFINIRTEALVNAYPGLGAAIDSIDGYFYCTCLFYDNGRIFFEKKDTVYEYLPSDGSVRKIVTVGSGETIEMVLDK